MNEYGKLIVLPKKNQFNYKIFERNLKYGEGHTKYLQEYSDKLNLGFKFGINDSNDAPCKIAVLGDVVIKTVDDVKTVIFYLPKTITDEQYTWIYKNQEYFQNQIVVSAISFTSEDNLEYIRINGFDNILNAINKKNVQIDKDFERKWKYVR